MINMGEMNVIELPLSPIIYQNPIASIHDEYGGNVIELSLSLTIYRNPIASTHDEYGGYEYDGPFTELHNLWKSYCFNP